MANTWQGEFPWQNLRTDGYEGTSPVKSFPPNGHGLYDMAGAPTTGLQHPATGDQGRGPNLGAPNYCLRYRPAARQSETIDTSTGHLGFRCVLR
jgi:formylglycine-generating enzyme